MKRLGLALALVVALSCAAVAQIGGLMMPGPAVPQASGGGCTQATAFLARNGGANSAIMTTMICGMVTDGTFQKLDGFWFFASDTAAHANLNLVSTSFTLAEIGSINPATLTANTGYTWSFDSYDTGLDPSTVSNFTKNNAAMGVCALNNRTTSNAGFAMGVSDVTTTADILTTLNSSQATFDLNEAIGATGATTTNQGSWFLNRVAAVGAGALTLYRNGNIGSPIGTNAGATFATPAGKTLYINGRNNNGSANGQVVGDIFAAAWIGGGFTTTDVTNFTNRLSTALTALGNTGC